jgi:hypothetical protein
MKNNHMEFDTRNTKIYKDIYRPSFRINRFIGTILSIILIGQSQAGNPDYHHFRKSR